MPQKTIKLLIYINSLFLVLLFCFSWFYYGANPAQIMRYLLAQVGSNLGVSLTVPENPFSNLAKQFQEKEAELQKREEAINEILRKTERNSRIILVLILSLIIILFFLVLVNFYFDYKTRKSQNLLK